MFISRENEEIFFSMKYISFSTIYIAIVIIGLRFWVNELTRVTPESSLCTQRVKTVDPCPRQLLLKCMW